MAQRFLRNVRVTIGDLRITDLLIRFRLRREASDTPADGHILLFNLTEQNERRIHERGVRTRVEAGYGGEFNLLFDGDVRRVERIRENQDRIIRVSIGGNATAQSRAIFIRSYEGAVAVRDIVRDAVETMGLELGPLAAIPADAQELDFSWQGPTRGLFGPGGILWPHGVRMYEDNGVIRFSRFGQTQDDRTAGVVVSQHTGMIESPTVTDDGLRVRSLIDARLKIDTRIRVESEHVAAEDHWKVIEVEHRGDNYDGPFETVVEARPVA